MTTSLKQMATVKATDSLLCFGDGGMRTKRVLNDFENVLQSP